MHHCKSGQQNSLCANTLSSDGLLQHKMAVEIHSMLINYGLRSKHFDVQNIKMILDVFIINLIDDVEEIYLEKDPSISF